MELSKVCRQIAKDLHEDPDMVHKIVMHQFQEIVSVMKDPDDTRDILINKLFKFKLKPRFKNNKTLKYSPK